MIDINKIAVLGGDQRQFTAARILEKKIPKKFFFWGIFDSKCTDDAHTWCDSYGDAIADASVVILPLPVSIDGVYLNCPSCGMSENVRLSTIIDCMENNTLLIGGRIPAKLYESAEKKGIRVKDYFLSEDFQIQNAYITAEAALSIAMNSLDKNICGADVAVTGYGRISKHLVRLLKGLGANVTVAARKDSDLAWGFSQGCSVLKLGDAPECRENIYKLANGYDVIYNTVPCRLFERAFLERADKKTFIIDLASAPGGVDICAAKELGSNVLWATSLPGKYAPASAGKIIAQCVGNILESEVGGV